jgi:DNA modification methylase
MSGIAPTSDIWPCDVRDGLRGLAAESVQCVVTSPPYYGLRDYKLPPLIWGSRTDCDHEWNSVVTHRSSGGPQVPQTKWANVAAVAEGQRDHRSGHCAICGAWRGCLGLEPSPDLYIQHMVEVFREVRRVLRDDGCVWLNLGDCFAKNGRSGLGLHSSLSTSGKPNPYSDHQKKIPEGAKPKDLLMMPARVALALQADGWYLRMDVVWAKGLSFCPTYAGSVMPESVTDRPAKTHEYIFLLTKSERYWYSAEAVKEQGTYPAGTKAAKGSGTREGNRRGGQRKKDVRESEGERRQTGSFQDRWDGKDGYAIYDGKRNLRSVWAIGTKPFKEAHFATFPPALVVPCITASTPPSACSACGKPYAHIVIKSDVPASVKAVFEAARTASADRTGRDDGHTQRKPNHVREVLIDTFEPACDCGTEPKPPLVCDIFSGAGTVGVVCKQMGRSFVGFDLSAEYCAMAEQRIARTEIG